MFVVILLMTLPAAADIVLYASSFNGLGGRRAVTSACQRTEPANCSGAAALLSFSDYDVRNLFASPGPPVVGPRGARIADSWASLWNGSIAISLRDAGVVDSYAYFTGSYADGVASHNCEDWTTAHYKAFGRAGLAWRTGNGWVSSGLSQCNKPHQIICACVTRAFNPWLW
jgi:hypothetical protein